jgi:hypothetical protein
MKLTFRLKRNIKKQVEVNPSDKLEVLVGKLGIGKTSKIVVKGIRYMLACNLTFNEIGVADNSCYNVIM